MKESIDQKVRQEHERFRKGRSTTDQTASLKIILEKSLESNSLKLVNFIDYEKTFNSVDRATLWNMMRHYRIPSKIVELIKEMYDGTSCKVINDGALSVSRSNLMLDRAVCFYHFCYFLP